MKILREAVYVLELLSEYDEAGSCRKLETNKA